MELQEFLTRQGETVAGFAARIGKKPQTVHRWARGERIPRDPENLSLIEEATKGLVTVSDFYRQARNGEETVDRKGPDRGKDAAA